MNASSKAILKIPETVKADTLEYRSRVGKFLAGQTNPVAFRAYRVPMGIYEQRTPDTYMVRIRIGAGLVLSEQLRCIARLAREYGSEDVHITTRQDIQIHSVKIENTPDVLEGLLEAGLSARGGGGNTVRNVTACPRAGVCPHEKFDVSGHSVATAEYLIRDRSSFNLPRKYKIVFSGCSRDCAFASIADLGFFAHVRDGRKGFAAYAAGGLGSNPRVAIRIEDFVEEAEIFEVAEAIKRLFDKYGDRSNKHKARLRYVLERFGEEKFTGLYRDMRAQVQQEGPGSDLPTISELPVRSGLSEAGGADSVPQHPDILAQKQQGLWTVRIRLPLGDISAEKLVRVADLAEQYADGLVRTTQLQNLLITSVPGANIKTLWDKLHETGIVGGGDRIPKVVACAGAATCKLGLCLSRGLAEAITDRLGKSPVADPDAGIRISGCPNSCGHHYIGQVGLQGRARRINGRLMPCYDVLIDAQTVEGGASLGERVGTVPAREIPDLIAAACESGRLDTAVLAELVRGRSDFASEAFADEYFFDYGADEPFSLAGRGPGECGAGVMDVIKVDIDQASQSLAAAHKGMDDRQASDHLYAATIAAARALLVIFGLEPRTDREAIASFKELLIEPRWVSADVATLLDEAVDYRLGDVASLGRSSGAVGELVRRIEQLFHSLDAGLNFTIEPVQSDAQQKLARSQEIAIIDLRGVGCPLNFVKAKLELEKVEVGRTLEVLLDEGEPVRNVPASFAGQGQEVLDIDNRGTHYSVKVKRVK